MKFLDVDGTEICPGDFVLYAASTEGAPAFEYGKVTKLSGASVRVQPLRGGYYGRAQPGDPEFRLGNKVNLGKAHRYASRVVDTKTVQNVKVLPGRDSLPARLDPLFEHGYI